MHTVIPATVLHSCLPYLGAGHHGRRRLIGVSGCPEQSAAGRLLDALQRESLRVRAIQLEARLANERRRVTVHLRNNNNNNDSVSNKNYN